MLDVLAQSLTVLEQLAPLEPSLRSRRKSLAEEIGRATESVALNIAEERALIAKARGYITANDFAAVEAPLDRVRAMLFRLTR